jgi:staphyloferrin B biosynthesis citrate synthase
MTDGHQRSGFRQRLRSGERLLGTFLKTPTTHATEIIGSAGFDFVVLDAEHAPLDRSDIDRMLVAARAAGIAALVRVADSTASALGSPLDCDASGLLIPHVTSAAMAREVTQACRFRSGRRGYSGSTRSAGFGSRTLRDNITTADNTTCLIAQIEDPMALDAIEDITEVDDLDGVFIGRADLAVAMRATSADTPEIRDAVIRITTAARRSGIAAVAFASSWPEVDWLTKAGVTSFVFDSDQGFLRKRAVEVASAFHGAVTLDETKSASDVAGW